MNRQRRRAKSRLQEKKELAAKTQGFWARNRYTIAVSIVGVVAAVGIGIATALPGVNFSSSDLEKAISISNYNISRCHSIIPPESQMGKITFDCNPFFQDMYEQLNDIGVINSDPQDFNASFLEFKQYFAGEGIVLTLDELVFSNGTKIPELLARYELGREQKTVETINGTKNLEVVTMGESVIKSFIEKKFLDAPDSGFGAYILKDTMYLNRHYFERLADSTWDELNSIEDIEVHKTQLRENLKDLAREDYSLEFLYGLSDLLNITEWQDLYESSSGREDFKRNFVEGLLATSYTHELNHLYDQGLSKSDMELRANLIEIVNIPNLPAKSKIQGYHQLKNLVGYLFSGSPNHQRAGSDFINCISSGIDQNRDALQDNPSMDYTGTNPGDLYRNNMIILMIPSLTTEHIQQLGVICYNYFFGQSQGK